MKKGALWHTYRDENGVKRQEPADPDGEAYKEYCYLRASVLDCIRETDEKINASPEVRKGAYGQMLRQLYSEYGCYYWCPEIVLNALGDDIEEIIRLVDAMRNAVFCVPLFFISTRVIRETCRGNYAKPLPKRRRGSPAVCRPQKQRRRCNFHTSSPQLLYIF